MNKWLIQSSGFYTSTLDEVFSSVKELSLNYADFGIIDNTITNLENIFETNCNYITRGGVKLLKVLKLLQQEDIVLNSLNNLNLSDESKEDFINRLANSVDYDVLKFDQQYYNSLNLPLLNLSASFVSFKDLETYVFKEPRFIKPSRDLKSFNGGIIYPDETILNYIYRTGYTKDIEDEVVVISELKEIYSEYRFFMYKDKILGCSRYMLNKKVNSEPFVPEEFKNFAIEMSKEYCPKDFYVVDLADTNKGIKIVEYNCWNCSGFYASNIKDIIYQINEIKS